ncbi:MAG: Microcystin dependent protein, partial [uncultured Nocardioidaceae bacterium]
VRTFHRRDPHGRLRLPAERLGALRRSAPPDQPARGALRAPRHLLRRERADALRAARPPRAQRCPPRHRARAEPSRGRAGRRRRGGCAHQGAAAAAQPQPTGRRRELEQQAGRPCSGRRWQVRRSRRQGDGADRRRRRWPAAREHGAVPRRQLHHRAGRDLSLAGV